MYGEDGEIIGYVKNGEVYYSDDIYIETSGDAKKLYVPLDMKVRIEMTGTDDGNFNYVLEEVVDGEPTGRRNYYDIPLTEGAKFEQDVDPAQLAPENGIAIESESGSIQPDEYLSADDMSAFVTVDAEESAEHFWDRITEEIHREIESHRRKGE